MPGTLRAHSVRILLLLLALGSFSGPAAIQGADTVKDLDGKQATEEFHQAIGDMRAQIEKIGTQRYYECLKVVGSTPFCACLRDSLPLVATFQMYVDVILNGGADRVATYGVTSPQEQNDIAAKIVSAREECAARANFK